MLPLYLLAAHMVGDFVFQTRWQALQKLRSVRLRMQHVAFYTVPFYVVLAVDWPGVPRAAGFLLALIALHFATDSVRFLSTLGDVIAWRFKTMPEKQAAWLDYAQADPIGHYNHSNEMSMPPNPWPAMSLMIDQSLHVVQLAVLGGIFLA